MKTKSKNDTPIQPLAIPGAWLLWLIPILIFGAFVGSLSNWDLTQKWLETEAGDVVKWWLLVTLAGAAVFPLLYRLLPGLADRGYTLARIGGLMLVGFVFWFLASTGLLRNTPGAMVLAWFLVVFASIVTWIKWSERPSRQELRRWAVDQLPLIVITEVLFLVALFAWAYFKAHNPELNSTEKPMEMAFINGVRNSATFPPQDPWYAGYAISYYYFGYVLAAALADLSNVPTGLAFNLTDALLFALAATGAFGVAYNLVRSVGPLERWRVGGRNAALGTGLLAATLVVLSGNLGTALVELPYRGYTSNIPVLKSIVSDDYFDFWDVTDRSGPYAIDIEPNQFDDVHQYRLLDKDDTLEVNQPLPPQYFLIPDADRDLIPDWDDEQQSVYKGRGEWWWWPYSRVVKDLDLTGNSIGTQPIAEVPQFSFILSDNHPHVLSLPFTFLIIGLAISLALRRNALQPWEVVLYGIICGGLIFANAWDAVYLLVVIAAEALRRLMRNGTGRLYGWNKFVQVVTLQEDTERNILLAGPVFLGVLVFFIWQGIAAPNTFWLLSFLVQIIVAAAITIPATLIINWLMDDNDWAGVARLAIWLILSFYVFYLPWITSFASQANGFFPNVVYPTRSQQFFLQFGIFYLLIVPLIVIEVIQARRRLNWVTIMTIVLIGLLLLFTVPVLSALFINWQCPIVGEKWGQVERFAEWSCQARDSLLGGYDSQSSLTLAGNVVRRRLLASPSEILMLLIIGIVLTRFFPRQYGWREHESDEPLNFSPNTGIVLLLIAAGTMAALIPDFMYLRDNFSQRINTVFKLYYQAWVLLSVSAAYSVYLVLSGVKRLYSEAPPLQMPRFTLWRGSYAALTGIVLVAGLLYPYYGIQHRAVQNSGRETARICPERFGAENCPPETALTLDGSSTLINGGRFWLISPDEYEAMECLADLEPPKSDAVLVEAWGGAYTPELGRFSMFTGIPTLLGWDNHEHQWRGMPEFVEVYGGQQRQSDIDAIYRLSAEQWQQVQQIFDRYGIDYVVVGMAERQRYKLETGEPIEELGKFAQLLDPVCKFGNVAVYRVSPQ